ncbi:hypothetical protein [Bordetella petrii]|uniref:hypothetical protein n=1 Tax=Bordetella petrii TaxID=94624 RepID=UPI0002DC7D3C|nr:hypothetical protein [Bordetella petrii]
MVEQDLFGRLVGLQRMAEEIAADSRLDQRTRQAIKSLAGACESYRGTAFELRSWSPEK